MRYPINEKVLLEGFKQSMDVQEGEMTQDDKEFIHFIVNAINKAYYAGVSDGMKQR